MFPLSLLNAAEGHPVRVELKNGESFNGTMVQCDNLMNLTLNDVLITSAEGDRFWNLKETYIRGAQIKFLHLPDEVLNNIQDERERALQQRNIQRDGGQGGGYQSRGGYQNRGGRGGGGGVGGRGGHQNQRGGYQQQQRGGGGYNRGGGGTGGGRGGYQQQQGGGARGGYQQQPHQQQQGTYGQFQAQQMQQQQQGAGQPPVQG